jgi:hypothetical protein
MAVFKNWENENETSSFPLNLGGFDGLGFMSSTW